MTLRCGTLVKMGAGAAGFDYTKVDTTALICQPLRTKLTW